MERVIHQVPSDFIVGFGLFTFICIVCFFIAVILSVVATVFAIKNRNALKRIEKKLNEPKEE